MKKALTLVLSLVLLLCLFPMQAGAAELEIKKTEVILCPDGSRLIITTRVLPSETRDTVSGSKTMAKQSVLGTTDWSATLVGNFTYNGTTATCTASILSFYPGTPNWSLDSSNPYPSGNTAYADFTVAHRMLGITISTNSYSLSLSCDKDGNLS
ncbi:MAG: hypothetical protein ACSW8F_06350 [bacterium]